MKIPAKLLRQTQHYGLKIAIALSISASLGCSKGEVSFTGIEDFGHVRSALLTPEQNITIYEFTSEGTLETGSRFQYQRVSLNNGLYSCSARLRYLSAVDQAIQDLLNATEDGQNPESVCAEMPAFLDSLILASDINRKASQHLHFDFLSGDTLELETYNIKTWNGSGSSSFGAVGYINYPEDDAPTGETFRAYRAAWNPERCDFDSATIESYPYSEPGRWFFTEGTIEIEDVEVGTSVSATFDTKIDDQNGSSAGSARGHFHASFCNDRAGYRSFRFPGGYLMPHWPQ